MNNIVIDCNVYISALLGSKTCQKAIGKAFTEYKVCYFLVPTVLRGNAYQLAGLSRLLQMLNGYKENAFSYPAVGGMG